MKLLNRILAVFSSGRSVNGRLTNEDAFWTEIKRATFLIRNLRDEDLNWSQPYFYLHQVDRILNNPQAISLESEQEVINHLYSAWTSIAVQIDALKDFELDSWWLYRVDAAAQHLFERVVPMLTPEMQGSFIQNIPNIHRECNHVK